MPDEYSGEFLEIIKKINILNRSPLNTQGIKSYSNLCMICAQHLYEENKLSDYDEENKYAGKMRNAIENADKSRRHLAPEYQDLIMKSYGLYHRNFSRDMPEILGTPDIREFIRLIFKNRPPVHELGISDTLNMLKRNASDLPAFYETDPKAQKKLGVRYFGSTEDLEKTDTHYFPVNTRNKSIWLNIPTEGFFYLFSENPHGEVSVLVPSYFAVTSMLESSTLGSKAIEFPSKLSIGVETNKQGLAILSIPGLYHVYGVVSKEPLPLPRGKVSLSRKPCKLSDKEVALLIMSLNKFTKDPKKKNPPWVSTYSRYYATVSSLVLDK